MTDLKFTNRIVVLLTMVLCVFLSPALPGQEVETKEAEDPKPAPEPPLFAVPDGSPAELLAFVEKVLRTPPKVRTRDAAAEHMQLQIAAMLAACEKVMQAEPTEEDEKKVIRYKTMALRAGARSNPEMQKQLEEYYKAQESDTRPFVVKLVAVRNLMERVGGLGQMSDDDRNSFVTELFELVTTHGLDRELYSAASTVGRVLSSGNDTEYAAIFHERLAELMRDSKEKEISSRAERTRGAARRIRLPGQFMEVMGETTKGEKFDWASYRGKVVLVDFWASWCGPCRREIPNMKAQLEKYGEAGFDIVGVNLDRTLEACEKYVANQGLSWTNLISSDPEQMGWDNPLAAHYGISGIPTAILVDKEGKVVSMKARGTELNRLLAELLGPVEPGEEGAEGESEE